LTFYTSFTLYNIAEVKIIERGGINMKKLTAFCLIIALILSSGCIGWADEDIIEGKNTRDIKSSGNPISICPYEIRVYGYEFNGANIYKTVTISNYSNSTAEVTCKTKINCSTYHISDSDILMMGGIITVPPKCSATAQIGIDSSVVGDFKAELQFSSNLSSSTIKIPIYTKDVSDDDYTPPNYKQLTISPSECNLTGTPGNQLVAKAIEITNNNESGTVYLKAKPIYGCTCGIIDHTKSLHISKDSTKKAYFTVKMPEHGDGFHVDLEMSIGSSNNKTILPVYNITKMLSIKNVKCVYDYYNKNIIITWDRLPYISRYRIYNGNEYELANAMEEDKGKHIIRNVEPSEILNFKRKIIAVNQIDEKISYDQMVYYLESKKPYYPAPTNVKIEYDDIKGQHVITWDPPIGENPDKYQVYYRYKKYGQIVSERKTVNGRAFKAKASPTEDRIYEIRAQSPSHGWGIPVTAQYIPAPENMVCIHNSAREQCKLTWDNPSSSVDKFMVYSSYNGGPYQFEQETGSLSYTKNGVSSNLKNKYKFKVVSVHNSGLIGEDAEIHLIDENLVQPETLMGHINIHENTANISWSAIPSAEGYNVYGALNGGSYNLLRRITGATECFLESPPPYDPPRDMQLKIKVKATNIYKCGQKDIIEMITFPADSIHPHPGRP
jgi:fibronectin type 3 domain-containing protein